MELLHFFIELVEQYGYIIVTVAILLESAGIPMPGETALVVAAAAAGAGHLNIAIVIICAASGAIAGDAGGYWIGRRYGRAFIDKFGKWIHLTPARMAQLEKLFLRHGPMTVFFGRFFTLLRTYSALFAGIWRMPYKTFTLYNALGGIVWASCFGMLGYLFGQNLPLLERIARTVGWALTIPVVLLIACSFLWRWIVKHQTGLIVRTKDIVARSFIGKLTQKYSWHIHWFLRHWTAAQYTVMHIVIGLMIATAGTWAFVRVAHSAISDARIGRWDDAIFQTLQNGATPLATMIFKMITTLGSYGVVVSAGIAIVLFLLHRNWKKALSLTAVVLGGQILVYVLKIAYARARPEQTDPLVVSVSGFGFSFPSAHTMESLVVYGIIAYFLILWSKRWSVATGLILLTVVLVFTIGFSRLYLGFNYLSDVLCGFAGGVVWLSSCITALELLRRGQVGDRRRKKRVPKIKRDNPAVAP